jgi:hypothetical protein
VNSLNAFGETALHAAILNRSEIAMMEISRKLLQSWCDVNTANRNGETALHFAVRLGYEPVISLLMQFGADPKVKTRSGVTAFDIGVHSMRIAMILEGKEKPPVPPRPRGRSFMEAAIYSIGVDCELEKMNDIRMKAIKELIDTEKGIKISRFLIISRLCLRLSFTN